MLIDALILAGGKSSRLGHVAKAGLIFERQTLLERTVAAAALADKIIIVGEAPGRPLPAHVLLTAEDPRFGGPVAALGAGVMLAASSGLADYTLVLACDMPAAASVARALVDALPSTGDADGIICVDESGKSQPLAAIYETAALTAALRAQPQLAGMSMRALISPLNLAELRVPGGATDDVDTWADAQRFGLSPPPDLATGGAGQ